MKDLRKEIRTKLAKRYQEIALRNPLLRDYVTEKQYVSVNLPYAVKNEISKRREEK